MIVEEIKMSDLKCVSVKYEKLESEWNKKKGRNMELVGMMSSRRKSLVLARNILEIGAQYGVETKDIPSFERYMAQLKTYYSDYPDLPESSLKYELLGLNLLRLLSQNRLAEFHIELELLLSIEAILNNPYISNPVALEQYIMEGTYNKILVMKDNVPSPRHAYFIDLLLITIRNEIGSCLEKAYEKISAPECAKMLYLNDKAMDGFVKERGWSIQPDQFVYFQATDKKTHEAEVPTLELAKMAITYAKEMEQIV
ncbi:PSMD8 [Lepeophtheirus salmonis]|uniref:26S proteasome non-ATPase regulatory subunit 8 n=1 Tax=Lepeophtheirus salmonis TaxID=72036 RepID=A0A7R8H8Z1_LEPSM|nr:PSMD8 [Lepeophtheirus salmonis]CAF2947971.1 PSMD8 [Lepeophtheirus salmonis]